MKFNDFMWYFMLFRYLCELLRSRWARAPPKHQYSYRNINVFSMGPSGALQVAQEVIFYQNILKLLEFSRILLK